MNLLLIIEWSHCYNEFAGLSLRMNLVDSTGEKLKLLVLSQEVHFSSGLSARDLELCVPAVHMNNVVASKHCCDAQRRCVLLRRCIVF